MPGKEDQDHYGGGDITDKVGQGSKEDSNASDHPMHQSEPPKGEQVEIRHHQANPGPAISKDFNAQQEGTKEERRAKAEELNK